jgi:hypothetical protein
MARRYSRPGGAHDHVNDNPAAVMRPPSPSAAANFDPAFMIKQRPVISREAIVDRACAVTFGVSA